MKNSNDYINEWNGIVSDAKDMLNAKNFDMYESLMEKANLIYEKIKKDDSLTYECKNFGISNYIFEDALPRLFKANKGAVKEFINVIKEDKNLLTQFKFYKALENYNEKLDARNYVNEAIGLVAENVDFKTIAKSNNKLGKIIEKYNIKPSENISNEKIELFEKCDFVLSNKKKLTNLNEHNDCVNYIVEYTKNNFNKINENKIDVYKLVEDFNKKYTNLLNEEEKTFVQEIMDFKAPQNNKKKENLFNRFKNECITTVDKLISEASEDEKCGLEAIKEQIIGKVYCAETIVGDLAKLLEIRDILMSE